MAEVGHVFGRDEVSHLLFADFVARKYKDWRLVSLEEVNHLHSRLVTFTKRRGMTVFDLDNLLVIPPPRNLGLWTFCTRVPNGSSAPGYFFWTPSVSW
jgi:hypothetical protein